MADAAISGEVQGLLDAISSLKDDFDSAFTALKAGTMSDDEVVAAFKPVSDALAALDAATKAESPPTQDAGTTDTGSVAPATPNVPTDGTTAVPPVTTPVANPVATDAANQDLSDTTGHGEAAPTPAS